MKDSFYELDHLGNIVEIDCVSGAVIETAPQLPTVRLKYNLPTASAIISKLLEGKTITSICKHESMPPIAAVYRWRRQHPDFDEKINEARRFAAEIMHDKVLDLADETTCKEDVHVNEFKSKQWKWSAEKNDPEKFGTRTKIVGDPNQPLGIILDTGIRRNEDDESITIEDAIEIEKGEVLDGNDGESIQQARRIQPDSEESDAGGTGAAESDTEQRPQASGSGERETES